MPAFPLLAAIGLMSLRPEAILPRLRILWLLRPIATAAVIALALVVVRNGLEIRQSENWRAAVAYLEASAEADDGWIFISKRGQLGYEYYAGWLAGGKPGATRPDILEPFSWDELAASETYYRSLSSGTTRLPDFSARHRRIWLVLSHEFDSTFDGDTSEAVRSWLTRRGYAARQRGFQNIRVILYERRA
jgi:hypothetical protein